VGFEIKATGDLHARPHVDGKLILKTKRSMGSGKLDGDIPHFIRQQMELNEEQFARAIGCPLTREEYVQILKDKKSFNRNPRRPRIPTRFATYFPRADCGTVGTDQVLPPPPIPNRMDHGCC
jgi:hypothetical protein